MAFVGVDLRPASVAAAALHGGRLGEPTVEATECSDSTTLIDQVVSLVERAAGGDMEGVGVALPRVVEFDSGRMLNTSRAALPGGNGHVDLPLSGVPLRGVLEKRLEVPVYVDNAANVAALAEAHDEELKLAVRHLVMFVFGTNVGGGLVLDGRIYRGATGAAAELGQTMLGLDLAGAVPAPMGFPQPGSLEAVAAGRAFDRLAAVAGRVHPDSALALLRVEGKSVLSADVVQAARDGDQAAARMVEIWGQRIGVAVANAIHTFDPEEVAIGGDAVHAGTLLLHPASRVAREYLVPGLGQHTMIRLARHVERGVLLGAALLAPSELGRRL